MARFLLYGRGIRFWYLFRIGEKVKELPSAFSQPPQRGKTFEAGRSLFIRIDRFSMSRYHVKQIKAKAKRRNERLIDQIDRELLEAENEINQVMFETGCAIRTGQDERDERGNSIEGKAQEEQLQVADATETTPEDSFSQAVLLMPAGTEVITHSLSNTKYNGVAGEVLSYDKKLQRYLVTMSGKQKPAALKHSNLRPKIIIEDIYVSIIHLSGQDRNYAGCVGRVFDCNDNSEECEIEYEDGKVVSTFYSNLSAVDPEQGQPSKSWASSFQEEVKISDAKTSETAKTKAGSLERKSLKSFRRKLLKKSQDDKVSSLLMKIGEQKMDQDEFDLKMRQHKTNFKILSAPSVQILNNRERRRALNKMVNVRNRALIEVVRANSTTSNMEYLLDKMLESARYICEHDYTCIHIHQKETSSFFSVCRKRGQKAHVSFDMQFMKSSGGSNTDAISYAYSSNDRVEWSLGKSLPYSANALQGLVEIETYNLIVIPIEDLDGRTVALMSFGNKRSSGDDCSPEDFSPNDVEALEFFVAEICNIFQERNHEILIHLAIQGGSNPGDEETGADDTQLLGQSVSANDAKPKRRKRTSNNRRYSNILKGASLRDFLAEYNPTGSSVNAGKNYTPKQKLQRLLPAFNAKKGFSFVRKKVQSWAFDPLRYASDELSPYCKAMFDNVIPLDTENFEVDREKLGCFVKTVLNGYRDIPYHNAKHAVSVAHISHMYVTDTSAKEFLLPIERLALVAAGLGHDIDHTGTTNAFHSATMSPLALTYNDVSILENHHAATTSRIFAGEDCKFLVSSDKNLMRHFRKVLIKSILATDMADHAGKTQKVRILARKLAQQREPGRALEGAMEPAFDVDDERSRNLLYGIIMHSADLSNPVIFDFKVVYKWAGMVCEEFHAQTIAEQEAGLPVTGYLQGVTENVKKAKLQISFYDFIVQPWFEAIAGVLPKVRLIYANIEQNRRHWVKLAKGADPEIILQSFDRKKETGAISQRRRVQGRRGNSYFFKGLQN